MANTEKLQATLSSTAQLEGRVQNQTTLVGTAAVPYSVGGGGGGTISWNDLTDKPFYSEEGVFLPETQLVFEDADGITITGFTSQFEVKEGSTVKTVYNGTAFTHTVLSEAGTLVFGDVNALLGGESDGSMFVAVLEDSPRGWSFASLAGDASATVKMNAINIVQLDAKYIPKSAFTPFEIDLSTVLYLTGDNRTIDATTAHFNGITQVFFENVLKNGIARVRLETNFMYSDSTGTGSSARKMTELVMLVNNREDKYVITDDNIKIDGVKAIGLTGFIGHWLINLVFEEDGDNPGVIHADGKNLLA